MLREGHRSSIPASTEAAAVLKGASAGHESGPLADASQGLSGPLRVACAQPIENSGVNHV